MIRTTSWKTVSCFMSINDDKIYKVIDMSVWIPYSSLHSALNDGLSFLLNYLSH